MWTPWTCRRVTNVNLAIDFPARLCTEPCSDCECDGVRAALTQVGRKHCWGAPRDPHHLILGTDITTPEIHHSSPLFSSESFKQRIVAQFTNSQRTTPTNPHLATFATSTMAENADANKKDGHIPSPLPSLSSSTASLGRSPPPPALKMAGSPDPRSHRGSFAEQMRGTPSSPRATRQPSLTQQALQDLLNNPPTKGGDAKFQGRDWKTVHLGEIVDSSLVRFAEYDTSVEDATNVSD
jgi:hypothetical protein